MNSAQCTIPLHPAGIGFAVKYGEVYDAELTECRVNSIYQSHICCLVHRNINLVFSPQHVTPPLLGAGVSSLIQHLSCAPHLDRCAFACVDELSADV